MLANLLPSSSAIAASSNSGRDFEPARTQGETGSPIDQSTISQVWQRKIRYRDLLWAIVGIIERPSSLSDPKPSGEPGSLGFGLNGTSRSREDPARVGQPGSGCYGSIGAPRWSRIGRMPQRRT